MIIITNQKKLLFAVRALEKIISRNVSLPILNSILIKTENGRVKLAATNLEVGINYWIGARIEENGEIAIPARIFSDFLSNITDENVTLKVQKNVVSINSDHYKTQILGMETKDFPIIPKILKNSPFKINSLTLKNALMNVFDSIAISETRPELSGIYINIVNNRAEFAATDSFRLSEKIIELKDGVSGSFILPRNTAVEIMRLMESLDEDVNFVVSENQILIFGEDFEIISRLIDGHYPEYKRVIPDKFISLVRINKSDFEKNVRMASIFSSTISDIKLKAGKDLMEITAKNSERGEIVANVACEIKNKPFEISVNYHYLLDGLKILPTENVVLEFTGDGSPLVLKGENLKDQTYVIMPLRN